MKKGKDIKTSVTSNTSRINKQGRPIREVIPPTVNKNIRENQSLKQNGSGSKREFWPYANPSQIPTVWPGEDEIKVNNFKNRNSILT
jgi:hypothetical protein